MHHQYPQLLSRLSAVVGRESAGLELRWMAQALRDDKHRNITLPDMVSRRMSGEPLQYILGQFKPDTNQ